MHADVEHVIRPSLDGLAVPKVETPEHVKIVERILDEREPKMGVPPGSVRLLLALESPKGLFNAYRRSEPPFSRELSLPPPSRRPPKKSIIAAASSRLSTTPGPAEKARSLSEDSCSICRSSIARARRLLWQRALQPSKAANYESL